MIKLSNGLLRRWMSNTGLQGLLTGGRIDIYGGVRPAHPDNAVGQPVIATITQGGATWGPLPDNPGGLQYMMILPHILEMSGSWVLKGNTAGTPTWFRVCGLGSDPGGYSGVLPRIDGDVGDDLRLPSETVDAATFATVPAFFIGFSSFN